MIKTQDTNTRWPFMMVSRWPPLKKDKVPIYCNVSLLPSVMLTFMSGPSIFKILNSMSDIKSKHQTIIYSI